MKNPRWPIYIVSKGRAYRPTTARELDRMAVPYRVVVEPQEVDDYARKIPRDRILALPFSNLGQGSIPARNWIWEHSVAEGHDRHWILDDNIFSFERFCRRRMTSVDASPFLWIEEFVGRYLNVALAGMQYSAFARGGTQPFELNTRIYSCILVLNSLPHRWRGRYNEDTDLSLRVLKDGWVTLLFYAYLIKKTTTMLMKGGNTDELYRQDDSFDGRLAMAESLQRQHPDVVTITRKWNRWQHVVDYRPFKGNKLIRKEGHHAGTKAGAHGVKAVTGQSLENGHQSERTEAHGPVSRCAPGTDRPSGRERMAAHHRAHDSTGPDHECRPGICDCSL